MACRAPRVFLVHRPTAVNITTGRMPLEDVNTRNIAAIPEMRRSSFVAFAVASSSDGKLDCGQSRSSATYTGPVANRDALRSVATSGCRSGDRRNPHPLIPRLCSLIVCAAIGTQFHAAVT